jgi:DNA-binding FrmR family transcriptional regulator
MGMADPEPASGPAERGYLRADHKDVLLKRLRRIEGQVRGVSAMIESEQYCIDVLTQIAAANGALRAVALRLLDDHLSHCVRTAVAEGPRQAEQAVAEASAAIARLVNS